MPILLSHFLLALFAWAQSSTLDAAQSATEYEQFRKDACTERSRELEESFRQDKEFVEELREAEREAKSAEKRLNVFNRLSPSYFESSLSKILREKWGFSDARVDGVGKVQRTWVGLLPSKRSRQLLVDPYELIYSGSFSVRIDPDYVPDLDQSLEKLKKEVLEHSQSDPKIIRAEFIRELSKRIPELSPQFLKTQEVQRAIDADLSHFLEAITIARALRYKDSYSATYHHLAHASSDAFARLDGIFKRLAQAIVARQSKALIAYFAVCSDYPTAWNSEFEVIDIIKRNIAEVSSDYAYLILSHAFGINLEISGREVILSPQDVLAAVLLLPRILFPTHPFSLNKGIFVVTVTDRPIDSGYNHIGTLATFQAFRGGSITLGPRLKGSETRELAKTLAHEIGHRIDFLSRWGISQSPVFQKSGSRMQVDCNRSSGIVQETVFVPEEIQGYCSDYAAWGGAREDVAEMIESYIPISGQNYLEGLLSRYLQCVEPAKYAKIRESAFADYEFFPDTDCSSADAKLVSDRCSKQCASFFGFESFENLKGQIDMSRVNLSFMTKLRAQGASGYAAEIRMGDEKHKGRLSLGQSQGTCESGAFLNLGSATKLPFKSFHWAILIEQKEFVLSFEWNGQVITGLGKAEIGYFGDTDIKGKLFDSEGKRMGSFHLDD